MAGRLLEVPFQCTDRSMSRRRYLAYRQGTVCFRHSNARFKEHTVGSNLRMCIQEILLHLGHRFLYLTSMNILIQCRLKLRDGMLKDAHAVFTGGESEQIEHGPGKASDSNDL